ncbi:MAG: peroxiredoxin [Acidiferrobacterales bacterium]
MTIKVGDKIPNVTLRRMTDEGPKTITTDEIFNRKRVVLFAVPGAFTPTCSKAHLPGFVVNVDAIRAKNVDSIVCLSVNDAFVMDAWGKNQNVDDNIMMVADGSAEFTKVVGLEHDRTDMGMGIRSLRYAMVVEDGIVKILNVEEPGEFKASSADTILGLL